MKWKLDNYLASIKHVKDEHRTSYASYFDTFEEAKLELVRRTKQRIENHKKELEKSIKLLNRIEKMSKPDQE